MIRIFEARQSDNAHAFPAGEEDVEKAIALLTLDSERNIEILGALNEIFDEIERTQASATSINAIEAQLAPA